jgi:hypothetical protein
MKKIIVEVDGTDIGVLYRRLRYIAEEIKAGAEDGVENGNPEGDHEFHIYEIPEG